YESSSIFLTGSCADCRAAIGPGDNAAHRMRKSSARSKRCRKRFFFPQLLNTMHRQSFVHENGPKTFKDLLSQRLPASRAWRSSVSELTIRLCNPAAIETQREGLRANFKCCCNLRRRGG